MDEEFLEVNRLRMLGRYKRSKHHLFGNKYDFANWYVGKLEAQEAKCAYCETDIRDIKRLIDNELLQARRVRGGGLRGPNLEIDRDNPFGIYGAENCYLVCYYCNNDKSYTLDSETYKRFFGQARHDFFQHLLNQL